MRKNLHTKTDMPVCPLCGYILKNYFNKGKRRRLEHCPRCLNPFVVDQLVVYNTKPIGIGETEYIILSNAVYEQAKKNAKKRGERVRKYVERLITSDSTPRASGSADFVKLNFDYSEMEDKEQ